MRIKPQYHAAVPPHTRQIVWYYSLILPVLAAALLLYWRIGTRLLKPYSTHPGGLVAMAALGTLLGLVVAGLYCTALENHGVDAWVRGFTAFLIYLFGGLSFGGFAMSGPSSSALANLFAHPWLFAGMCSACSLFAGAIFWGFVPVKRDK